MKKRQPKSNYNRKLILFSCFLSLLIIMSCSNNKPKDFLTLNPNNIETLMSEHKNYIKSEDTVNNHILLKNFTDNNLTEEFIFTKEGLLLEYVFYNIHFNEPVYIIDFNETGSIIEQKGKPIYAASPFFNKNDMVKDSFFVFLYHATPPQFHSSFTIYLQDTITGQLINKCSDIVVDDKISLFNELVNSKIKFNNYYVVSKMTSEFDSTFTRTDTVKFTIKSAKLLR